jgi:uncharacterized protein with GYD domain
MPTYVTLIKYTQKGVENMKESPNRLDTAKELFKSMGGEIKAYYLAMGRKISITPVDTPTYKNIQAEKYKAGHESGAKNAY